MEGRFGHDFGQVRVHTDGPAAASASTIQAEAYTVGNHVVFALTTDEFSEFRDRILVLTLFDSEHSDLDSRQV